MFFVSDKYSQLINIPIFFGVKSRFLQNISSNKDFSNKLIHVSNKFALFRVSYYNIENKNLIISNMKIYILRHEDRTEDATFFSPLTEKGLNNANNLIDYLEKLGITKIYCSPYIRTMQTIYPFAKKNNFKLNLDYGLIEIQHPTIIPPKSVNIKLPSYIAKQFIFNEDYTSSIKASDIIYPEDSYALELRTKKFIKSIITKFYKTNETILIVTHQGLCKVILSIINKFGKFKPHSDLIENYPLGKISLIFEGTEWTYKKVN